MGDPISIKITCLGDKDFYNIVGPFLGRRDIYKELGSPIFVDEGKEFYVAINGTEPAAISATEPIRRGIRITSMFVESQYRGRGLFNRLLTIQIQKHGAKPIEVVATRKSAFLYEKMGFRVLRETVNYVFMRREGNGLWEK